MKNKMYILVTISGIHTQIAEKTDIKGYTVAILEAFMPDLEELEKWSDEKVDKFIADNNKRMEAICKFLNDNNL